MHRRNSRRGCRPILEPLDDRCLLSGFTPAELAHAYGLDSIAFATPDGTVVRGDGTGQTIALIEAYHDPNLVSDLQAFSRAFNLPQTVPTVINLGGARTDAGWALETSLDVEWAHAIAPGANLVVIEAKSQTRQALTAAVNVARRMPQVTVVSMSWGFAEAPYQANAPFRTPPGHAGITFVAASGDDGLGGGANWPAVSPNVLSVGGTSLFIGPSGGYMAEGPWYDSGGGLSRYEPEPAYQRAIQATGRRSTPDVAFLGDPNTGVAVYETTPGWGAGGWEVVGGTSLGTPAWAAIIAIVNQGRALAGKGSLDGASQTLPALYGLPSSDFHAIAPMPWRGTAQGANLSTGLGTPVAPNLIADLMAFDRTTPLRTSARRGPSPFAHARVRSRARAVRPHRGRAHRLEPGTVAALHRPRPSSFAHSRPIVSRAAGPAPAQNRPERDRFVAQSAVSPTSNATFFAALAPDAANEDAQRERG